MMPQTASQNSDQSNSQQQTNAVESDEMMNGSAGEEMGLLQDKVLQKEGEDRFKSTSDCLRTR